MDPLSFGVLVGVPLAWHLAMTGYAYVDAGKHDMSQRKWGTVAFLIPFFGFFAYVFERDERTRDPEPDLFADGTYRVHKSRANEDPFVSGEGRTDGDGLERNGDH